MAAQENLSYVAADIPVPAGLEYVHHDFERRFAERALGGDAGLRVSHETGRRDRVTLFADRLVAGENRYTVYFKATSSGTFAFPAATVEAMYFPSITGRSDRGLVSVEPFADSVAGRANVSTQ